MNTNKKKLLSTLFLKHLDTHFYVRLSSHRSGKQASFVYV
jgi:hypothetical protein